MLLTPMLNPNIIAPAIPNLDLPSISDSGSNSNGNVTAKPQDGSTSLTPGVDDSFAGYLSGLFESLKEQNDKDRSFNSAEAEFNRIFQSKEAKKQRDWYTELSNTAYQRAMADMKKAGLNPILAYSQGSASSSGTAVPAGSAASHQSQGGDTFSSVLTALSKIIGNITDIAGLFIPSVSIIKK